MNAAVICAAPPTACIPAKMRADTTTATTPFVRLTRPPSTMPRKTISSTIGPKNTYTKINATAISPVA